MLISGAMLLGPPTGLHAVCTRVLACVPCVLAREDVWWSGSRLECQAHLSEGDGPPGDRRLASHRSSAARSILVHLAGGSLCPPGPPGRRPSGAGRGPHP